MACPGCASLGMGEPAADPASAGPWSSMTQAPTGLEQPTNQPNIAVCYIRLEQPINQPKRLLGSALVQQDQASTRARVAGQEGSAPDREEGSAFL